jgi:photosystem II stability/assembly factor-like uncharacterized protein
VRALASAPSRPTTVYAGLERGGVYRSTNAGRTWSQASGGLQTIYAIYELAVAPTSPETVYAITPVGLFRTTNGGGSWQELDPAGEAPDGARRIAVHPRDSRIVYALMFEGGLRRSADGGDSWEDLPEAPPDLYILRIDPVRPDILYAITFDNDSGLWKSTDEGRTWARTRGTERIRELEIDPRSPQTLYATFSTSDPGRFFQRSTDGGETWVPLPAPAGDGLFLLVGTGLRGTQLTLFGTTTQRFYRSLNGGLSWSEADAGLPASPLSFGPAAATSGALLLSTYEGVFRSTNGGRSWVSSSRNLKEGLIGGLAGGSALYVGTQGQGIYESVDRQGGWRRLPLRTELAGRFYGPLAADPRQPGRIYASTFQGIARSEDGGASWEIADTSCLRADEIVIDPTRPETLYILGNRSVGGSCSRTAPVCGVQKSEDGGRTWTCIRSGLPDQDLSLLTVDPHHPSTLLVRAEYDLYRSTDGGASWSLLSPFNAATGPVPRSLVFDPREPGRVYAGFQTTVARSTDGGRTWRHFRHGSPSRDAVVLDLEIDPVNPRTLYAMTSGAGVLKSTDAGETWAPLGTGLEGFHPEALLLDPRDRSTLYVRTLSDGLLKLTQSATP